MEPPRTKTQVRGRVVGRWADCPKALIRLEDERVIEAAGAAPFGALANVDDEVLVYFGDGDEVIGWMFAEHNTGVNYELEDGRP